MIHTVMGTVLILMNIGAISLFFLDGEEDEYANHTHEQLNLLIQEDKSLLRQAPVYARSYFTSPYPVYDPARVVLCTGCLQVTRDNGRRCCKDVCLIQSSGALYFVIDHKYVDGFLEPFVHDVVLTKPLPSYIRLKLLKAYRPEAYQQYLDVTGIVHD